MVLIPCTLSDHALYLYQNLGKYLLVFLSFYVDTKNIQKGKFHKNVGRVTFLVFCTSSDITSYFYEINENTFYGLKLT